MNQRTPNSPCSACPRHKHTPRDPETLKALQNRLHRMIGQLSGIGSMLDDNRYCGDILTQIAAVESALQNFGFIILQEHMKTCVTDAIREGDTQVLDEAVELIKKLK